MDFPLWYKVPNPPCGLQASPRTACWPPTSLALPSPRAPGPPPTPRGAPSTPGLALTAPSTQDLLHLLLLLLLSRRTRPHLSVLHLKPQAICLLCLGSESFRPHERGLCLFCSRLDSSTKPGTPSVAGPQDQAQTLFKGTYCGFGLFVPHLRSAPSGGRLAAAHGVIEGLVRPLSFPLLLQNSSLSDADSNCLKTSGIKSQDCHSHSRTSKCRDAMCRPRICPNELCN